MSTALAVVSGGMDSVTLAHYYADQFDHLVVLSVFYGQRHERELDCAKACAAKLGAEWHLVDLSDAGRLLSGSALTDPSVAVPEGHYADETMRATVVPNRNAILLSVGVGVAVAKKAVRVGTAVHAGDHPIYPDCRREFIAALDVAAKLGNEGFTEPGFRVEAPFSAMTKAEIASFGDKLGVDFANTWSCYQGGDRHCGRCATCVERQEAFDAAGVPDPTEYNDPDHWRSVCK